MRSPPDLTSALPAPRDDEPPELRARIVKELRDHLECAFQRELVLTRDENEARRRALVKFGDPARLARKLWFDALKEQIMSQRILIGLCAAMTAACLAMGAFNWKVAGDNAAAVGRLIEQSAAANVALVEQSRETNKLLLEQSREGNESLLRNMQALSAAAPGGASPEWVSFKVRLALDKPGGAAATGYQVVVTDHDHDALRSQGTQPVSRLIRIEEKSDAGGLLDCGRLPSGNYVITVQTPWQGELQREVYVRAGRAEQVEEIVCPSAEEPGVDVALELGAPEDLRRGSWGAVCEFSREGQMVNGERWQPKFRVKLLIVTIDGKIWNYHDLSHLTNDKLRIKSLKPVLSGAQHWIGPQHAVRVYGFVFLPPKPETSQLATYLKATSDSSGIYRELRLDAAGVNTVRIEVPAALHEAIRSELNRQAESKEKTEVPAEPAS